MKKPLTLLVVFLLLIPIYRSVAQEIVGSFSLILSPSTPKPKQVVDISIDAPGVDLDASNIKWDVNGVNIKSGQGEKNLTITAGDLGQQTNVRATVTSPIGTFTMSEIINPSEIDVLWQGDTYSPPFYKGRPLWTHQSQITLVAMPHVIISGVEKSPSALVYKWTKNGTVLGNISGVGKNSLTLTDSILSKPQTIKVDALTDKNTLLASQTLEITPLSPTLLVYEDSPLYGILFHKEVGSGYAIKSQEVTFTAFPLFFSTSNRLNSLIQYTWNTNAGDTEKNNSVTYRVPDGASGSSQVTVRAEHKSNLIQFASKSFLVEFGNR